MPTTITRGNATAPRVLIVDDEDSVLETLAAVVQREGCEVTTASSHPAASAALQARSFDLLLTDLCIDREDDGLELLQQARESQPDIAAVVLTGYGSQASAVSAMRHGASDYLNKPCGIEELQAAIRTGLARIPASSATETRPTSQPASELSNRFHAHLRSLDSWLAKLMSEVREVAPESTHLQYYAGQVHLAAARLNALVDTALPGTSAELGLDVRHQAEDVLGSTPEPLEAPRPKPA